MLVNIPDPIYHYSSNEVIDNQWHTVPSKFYNRLDEFGPIASEKESHFSKHQIYIDNLLQFKQESTPDM